MHSPPINCNVGHSQAQLGAQSSNTCSLQALPLTCVNMFFTVLVWGDPEEGQLVPGKSQQANRKKKNSSQAGTLTRHKAGKQSPQGKCIERSSFATGKSRLPFG